jgi:hypothetical protein
MERPRCKLLSAGRKLHLFFHGKAASVIANLKGKLMARVPQRYGDRVGTPVTNGIRKSLPHKLKYVVLDLSRHFNS